MRRIDKGPEPSFLLEYRLTTGEPRPCLEAVDCPKDELRAELVRRQGGLCCYCQGRIKPTRKKTRIEHFRAQSTHPHLDLSWANLWGACQGGQHPLTHCDVHKGHRACDLDPSTVRDEDFSYAADGTIRHADSALSAQLEEVLNLNTGPLKQARRKAVQGFIEGIKREGAWPRSFLERELDRLDTPGKRGLRPYVGALQHALRKRLARA